MRIFLGVLIVFFIVFTGFSQQNLIKKITIVNGLPSNNIKCIFKDSRGYFWIGTEAGLCKYDGKYFTYIGEKEGFKYDKVWSIVEDKQHILWMSVYGEGLCKYDGKKFTYFNESDGLCSNFIRKIHYSSKNDCLVLATENGISIFKNNRFKNFIKKYGIRGFQVTGVDESEDKILVTTSYNGVYQLNYNKDLKKITLDSLFFNQTSYSSRIINQQYISSGPAFDVLTCNLSGKELTRFKLPIIWDYANHNNNIYYAGWNVTNPTGGLFIKSIVTNQISQLSSIPSWCLYLDKASQTLWAGTINDGILIFDLSETIKLLPPKTINAPIWNIQTVYKSNNHAIWIGAKDNISVYQKGSIINFDKTALIGKIDKYLQLNNLTSKRRVLLPLIKEKEGFTTFQFIEDKNHNIFLNFTWGILVFDKLFNVSYFNGTDGGYATFNKKDVLYYQHNYTSHVLKIPNRWDMNTTSVVRIENTNIPYSIHTVCKQGDLNWFGTTSNGLYLLVKGKFISLLKQKLFMEKNIKYLYVLPQTKELLIGTNSGKVYISEWNGKRLLIHTILTNQNVLIGNTISFISSYKNYLMVGTNKGINLLKNGKFHRLLDASVGIINTNFTDAVIHENLLFVATNQGGYQINISKLLESTDQSNPTIHLTNYTVLGKKYVSDKSWNNYTQTYFTFPYNQNTFEFHFETPNSIYASKNQFRYKIEGLTNSWSKFSSDGTLKLMAVPFGKYTIRVQGRNISTGQYFTPKIIELMITPPFWKTLWFIGFTILLVTCSIYYSVKYRIKTIREREHEKSILSNKLTETKLEALRAQMNPHFTFNAMNSIQNFIIDNDTRQAMFYLGEFSKLIRQTLENASEKFMSLDTEIQFLESYMNVQKMRFDRVQTSITMDNSVDKYRTQIPPLILQPFIENAFEHAFDSKSEKKQSIQIHFSIENELLVCIIKDNGKGFNAGTSSTLHKSFGQKLTKERLDLLNREFNTDVFRFEIRNISDGTSEELGTEVRISFQLMLE
jgi:ligand-binding sensor domain-containing protein